MSRSGLIAAAAILSMALGGAAQAATTWKGHSVLNGGKGYLNAPLGQLSYRDQGPKESKHVLLLMHQSPMSMVELGAVQNALAAKGLRVIIVDSPGYGMSDQPAGFPSMADFADNLVPALDQLQVRKVIIGGHHTGASIAVAFAARHPDRTAGIILNGTPVFTQAEADKWKTQEPMEATVKADGSHLTRMFRGSDLSKSKDTDYDVAGRTWMTVGMFMQGKDVGHPAAFDYLMEHDLKSIKTPGLIITNAKDVIHDLDQRAAKMRPDFKFVELGPEPYSLMFDPQPWADTVAAWVRTLP